MNEWYVNDFILFWNVCFQRLRLTHNLSVRRIRIPFNKILLKKGKKTQNSKLNRNFKVMFWGMHSNSIQMWGQPQKEFTRGEMFWREWYNHFSSSIDSFSSIYNWCFESVVWDNSFIQNDWHDPFSYI